MSLYSIPRRVIHDEGQTRWYAPVLVRWGYLSRLDEIISRLKAAEIDYGDFGITIGAQDNLHVAERHLSDLGKTAKKFQIALSFAGEHRAFVDQVAACLATVAGRERVLYDKYHEANFARIDLDTYLQDLYHNHADLIVVFLSTEYESKEWCGLEWRAIRDLIKQRKSETMMLFRFDSAAPLPGLFSIDGYIWIGSRDPIDVARLILQRSANMD
ncbi:MAG TPA: TIR domain-containing protein [Pirellulales bacterium]